MRILSIQSSVAYGHAGNSAATFPLQRLGHEVWPVLTVHFSNHTGYGSWRGQVFDPAMVADVVEGIAERGMLGLADAVLTGYQGSTGVAQVVLDAVARVRALNPAAVYCCDPVMGDVGRGMFVLPGIPELIREQVVPAADIVTPNEYELAYLAGSGGDPETAVPADVSSMDRLLAAVDRVRAMGPSTVLVTSVGSVAAGADSRRIGMVAVDASGAYQVWTPLLPVTVSGAGDVTAALFLVHLAEHGIAGALARTASSVFGIMAETARRHSPEIALIPAQESIAHPGCEFEVTRLR